MTNAIATATPVERLPIAPIANESAAILSVIERMATNPDIDPARIERFIDLKMKMDAAVARKAFDAAMSAAKADIKPIERNATGHNSKRYADFSAIANAVDPVLSRHGLSYRFRTRQDDKMIHVTCVLAHETGHSEETTLSGPADASGSKNAIQAIGSTLTYLQRYSLVQALGLAAANDDDGKAAGIGDLVNMEQLEQLEALIAETGADTARFCTFLKVASLAELPAAKFDTAVRAIEAKRAKK